MLKLGIFPNVSKDNICSVLGWIVEYLQAAGIEIAMPQQAAGHFGYASLGRADGELLADIDAALTIGGDGTMLNTVRCLAPAGIPVCGINMGRLGFLTEIEVPEMKRMMDKIIAKDYKVEDRLMLSACVISNGQEMFHCIALNDVVLAKNGLARLVRLNLAIDGQLTTQYPADGIIVSTSTGSTGYALSAGAPIINPSINVIMVTPICPHTLDARSLVISEQEEVEISAHASADDDIILTADGQTIYHLSAGDIVRINRAEYDAKFIVFGDKNYYSRLYSKLRRSDSYADI